MQSGSSGLPVSELWLMPAGLLTAESCLLFQLHNQATVLPPTVIAEDIVTNEYRDIILRPTI